MATASIATIGDIQEVETFPHIPVNSRCGVCNFLFTMDEEFLVLARSGKTGKLEVHRDICLFPVWRNSISFLPSDGNGFVWVRYRINDKLICRHRACAFCAEWCTEATSIHNDCFALVLRECRAHNKLNLLLTSATWRFPWSPWYGGYVLNLQDEPEITGAAAIHLAAARFDMPQANSLPTELVREIAKKTEFGLLERLAAALEVASELSREEPDRTVSIPLCEVLAWERGNTPRTGGTVAGQFIRLTIDCRGLSKIEVLPGKPEYNSHRHDGLAFVIAEEAMFEGVTAHLKRGLIRLELPKSIKGFRIWDTPTPPSIKQMHSLTPEPPSPTARFQTIDLSRTTGISFLVCYNRVYGIHAHTVSQPSAAEPFRRVLEFWRTRGLWLYVPIPSMEKVLALGVLSLPDTNPRKRLLLPMLRTALAGDILIGLEPETRTHTESIFLGTDPQAMVCYMEHENDIINFAGVISAPTESKAASTWTPPFQFPDKTFFPTYSSWKGHISGAPLDGITRVRIFKNQKTGHCRGLLVDYQNGAQRALGECRLGLDPVERYEKPLQIFVAEESYTRPNNQRLPQVGVYIQTKAHSFNPHPDGRGALVHLTETNGAYLNFVFRSEEFCMFSVTRPTLDRVAEVDTLWSTLT